MPKGVLGLNKNSAVLRALQGKKKPKATAKDKQQDKKIAQISRRVDAGLFYVYRNVAIARAAQAGTITCMNAMAVGGQDGQRLGTTINIRSLLLNIELYNDVDTGGTPITGPAGKDTRIMVVWDREPNGLTYNNSDLLSNSGSDANNYWAVFNYYNKKRFKVLYDHTFHLAPGPNTRAAVAATQYEYGEIPGRSGILKIRKRFKRGLKAYYNSGIAGTIADINSGALFVVCYCESNQAIQYGFRSVMTYDA